jgi:hypothetical protein
MLSIIFAFGAVRTPRAQTQTKEFTAQELDQLLAPIALYPDALLSQVLMAAGYPLEVVEAARWSRANPALKGDAAVNAVKGEDWDVSVKSLVAFPTVLAQMDAHLDWTQKLGDAMISQQQDVADSIQRLRARATRAGNLKSTPQQTVTTQGSGENIQYLITPADPQVVYVPSYDPYWAYGAWPYPDYPPIYYPLPGALEVGFFWGLGFLVAGALFAGWHWGGWGHSWAHVDGHRAASIDHHFDAAKIGADGRWQHNPDHRRGVGYRDAVTRQQFGQGPRLGIEERQQFRGRLEGNVGARPGLAPQHPTVLRGDIQRPSALSGVDRGPQVNHEALRGQMQMNHAFSHPNFGGSDFHPGGFNGGGFHSGGFHGGGLNRGFHVGGLNAGGFHGGGHR